jgi:hypothetical protein
LLDEAVMSDTTRNSGQFSAVELAFFAAGEGEKTEPVETFADLDEGVRRPSILRRLFSRKSTNA